ncbi:MAG TPA: hypothetical protein PLD18_08890 [Flavobacterium sp.]|nr:hypothetical protein [Flavobacterium sp.]HRA73230.1 hypothetical protein [Flavobacterium sp.]
MSKTLYQALKDKNNPDIIRDEGPFICTTDEAWLGHGYYFWDTFKHLPHWWGESKLNNSYVVCKAKCDFSSKECFDLVGEPEHMDLFGAIVEVMNKEGLLDENTTVAEVIYHLKNKLGIFHWKASRVVGVLSISPKLYSHYTFRMIFEEGHKSFLDYRPAIQICLYEKDALNFRDYEIVYPDKYLTS